METSDYIEIFRSAYREDPANMNDAILALKNSGASQIDCVRVIAKELRISLTEADAFVLNSPAWTKESEDARKFRDEFGDFLENL